MNLLELNIFRGSIFKQAKFLISSPQNAQPVFYISEAGTISKEVLPMFTGFMCPAVVKKAWVVIHSLKFSVYKNGIPLKSEVASLISDRSYVPLDPNGIIKKKEKERVTSLVDIAKLRYNEALADSDKNHDDKRDTSAMVINGGMIIIGIMVLAAIIMHFAGGGS